MSEVHTAAAIVQLEQFRTVVALPDGLFDGLPWTEATLRAMRGRIAWNAYAELLDRLGAACGDDSTIERVGATTGEPSPGLALLLRSVVSGPLEVLRLWERMAPLVWTSLAVEVVEPAPHRAELRVRLGDGYRGCRTMFCASVTSVASLPRGIGLDALELEHADFSDRHGVYRYVLPPSPTAPTRRPHPLEEPWPWPGAAEELRRASARAVDAEREREALAGARPTFAVRNGSIAWANAAARIELEQDPTLAGRVCEASDEDPDLAVARLEAGHLLVQLRGSPTENAARCATAVRRWSLTAAQARVLDHVVSGRSNRESARALAIDESTVEVHVTQLLRRSRTASRAALVRAYWTL